jgi:hypothetical protein
MIPLGHQTEHTVIYLSPIWGSAGGDFRPPLLVDPELIPAEIKWTQSPRQLIGTPKQRSTYLQGQELFLNREPAVLADHYRGAGSTRKPVESEELAQSKGSSANKPA